MKMKIPNKIKIGEKEYKITEKNYYLQDSVGGSINYNLNKLDIRKKTDARDKEINFFHEVAHAVLRELEFNNPKMHPFRNNEEVVHEMGLILRKTFLDLLTKQGDR